jgi:hypothetical protein
LDADDQGELRRARRLRRLEEELTDEGVFPVTADYFDDGGAESDPDALQTLLLQELGYALQPPVHEERRPTYGSVVAKQRERLLERLTEQGVRLIEVEGDVPLDRLRALCDGRTSFLLLDSEGPIAVAEVGASNELALVELITEVEGLAIQRLSDGSVKLFTGRGLYLHEAGDWRVKPYAHPDSSPIAIVGSRITRSSIGPARLFASPAECSTHRGNAGLGSGGSSIRSAEPPG